VVVSQIVAEQANALLLKFKTSVSDLDPHDSHVSYHLSDDGVQGMESPVQVLGAGMRLVTLNGGSPSPRPVIAICLAQRTVEYAAPNERGPYMAAKH
jgi:hypothetical protein